MNMKNMKNMKTFTLSRTVTRRLVGIGLLAALVVAGRRGSNPGEPEQGPPSEWEYSQPEDPNLESPPKSRRDHLNSEWKRLLKETVEHGGWKNAKRMTELMATHRDSGWQGLNDADFRSCMESKAAPDQSVSKSNGTELLPAAMTAYDEATTKGCVIRRVNEIVEKNTRMADDMADPYHFRMQLDKLKSSLEKMKLIKFEFTDADIKELTEAYEKYWNVFRYGVAISEEDHTKRQTVRTAFMDARDNLIKALKSRQEGQKSATPTTPVELVDHDWFVAAKEAWNADLTAVETAVTEKRLLRLGVGIRLRKLERTLPPRAKDRLQDLRTAYTDFEFGGFQDEDGKKVKAIAKEIAGTL